MYLGSICNSRRDYRIFLRRGLNSLAPSSPVGELTRVTTPATGFDPSLRIRRSLPPWPCDRVWPRHWAGHCPLLQDRYEPMATYMCACWVGFRDAVGLGCCHVKTDFDQPAIPNDPKSCPARLCVPGRLTRLAPGDLRRARAGSPCTPHPVWCRLASWQPRHALGSPMKPERMVACFGNCDETLVLLRSSTREDP